MMRSTPLRSERGESAVSVLMGALIGLIVLSAFSLFWVQSDKAATQNVAMTGQESKALQVLNRVGRDVQDSTRILHATAVDLVVARENPNVATDIALTRYRIKSGLFTQQTWKRAPESALTVPHPLGAWDELDFATADPTMICDESARASTVQTCAVIAEDVIDDGSRSKFAYQAKDGSPWDGTDLTQIARVDISLVTGAGKGEVALESSAAVDTTVSADGGGTPSTRFLPCPSGLTPPATVRRGGEDVPLVSWGAVPNAERYRVSANGTNLATVTGTSWTGQPGTFRDDTTYTFSVQPIAAGYGSDKCLAGPWNKVGPQVPTPGAFGMQAWAKNYSLNTVTWDQFPGATGYRIDRRRHDTNGSWHTGVGTVGAGVRTWDDALVRGAPNSNDQSQLGSVYEYRVVALGPGKKSDTGFVTQFPADPVFTALGSYRKTGAEAAKDTLKTPTHIGQNLVTWSAVRSANRYEVSKYQAYESLTGNNRISPVGNPAAVSALSYEDGSVKRGSETLYRTTALNQCTQRSGSQVVLQRCESPNHDDVPTLQNLKRAYQVPKAPETTVTDEPTLEKQTYTVTSSHTIDTDASRPYCDSDPEAAECGYRLQVRNEAKGSTEDIGDRSLRSDSPWGSSDWVAARACNAGGCSPVVTPGGAWIKEQAENFNVKWVHEYPGPFETAIKREDLGQEFLMNVYSSNPSPEPANTAATMTIPWTRSAGVMADDGAYTVRWTATKRDPNDRSGRKTFDASTTRFDGPFGNGVRVTPGAQYEVTVTAQAANGLDRTITTRVTMPPPPVSFFQIGTFCNTGQNQNGWKAAFRYSPFGVSDNTNPDAKLPWVSLKSSIDRYVIRAFRGTAPRGEDPFVYLQSGLNSVEWDGGNAQNNLVTWAPETPIRLFREIDEPTPSTADELMGSNTNTRLMNNSVGSGGAMSITAISPLDPDSEVRDPRSKQMTVNLWKVGSEPVACQPGTGWHWNGNSVPVVRWAFPGTKGDQPNRSVWDVTGY
ncbi:hypothetical protein [Nocardioides pakistanensis]